ncbi:UNVERIFIED_CONTAM: hypothetical protein RMT77_019187 [Armadillidium vulgare]
MKCYYVTLRRNRLMYFSSLYLILFLSYVVTSVSSQDLGVPLPVLRENSGQHKNINLNAPFTVKLDDQNDGYRGVAGFDSNKGVSFKGPMPQRGPGSFYTSKTLF